MKNLLKISLMGTLLFLSLFASSCKKDDASTTGKVFKFKANGQQWTATNVVVQTHSNWIDVIATKGNETFVMSIEDKTGNQTESNYYAYLDWVIGGQDYVYADDFNIYVNELGDHLSGNFTATMSDDNGGTITNITDGEFNIDL